MHALLQLVHVVSQVVDLELEPTLGLDEARLRLGAYIFKRLHFCSEVRAYASFVGV